MKKLASALVFVLLAGVARGGDEKDIIKRLREAGAEVWKLDDGLGVTIPAKTNTSAALTELCELDRLLGLYIKSGPLSDADMRVVGSLTGLRYLTFHSKSGVTDARLKQVTRLCELRFLSLSSNPVTDAGLAELAGLARLEALWLDNTAVTDAGLRHLEGMSRLRILTLHICPNISNAGVDRLQKALPECKIRYFRR